MLVVGFEARLRTPRLERLIADGVGGAILFARNIEAKRQVEELTLDLKRFADRPFILSVDQEGGRVARLRGEPYAALPPMREVGNREDSNAASADIAEGLGRLVGYELAALGFDLDFAPVLDVDTNPANPIIGDRSFHHTPEVVSRLGIAFARGLEDAGVASCGKHFPGHGDTRVDSHLDLPSVEHQRERLEALEFLPFAAYAKAQLASVMTAHILVPDLDPKLPATMSRIILQDILREQLGFRGLIVSDDLCMKAIAEHFPLEQVMVEATAAGVDIFLICEGHDTQEAALEHLVHAAEKSQALRRCIAASEERREQFCSRFVRDSTAPRNAFGTPEHQRLLSVLAEFQTKL